MELPATEPTGSRTYLVIEWAPMGIAIGLILSMLSEVEELLYLAAVVGAVASFTVGRMSGQSGELSLQVRLLKFAKGWALVVALAALSAIHGKWQPMVFFALVGILSLILFWFGTKSSS